MRKFLTRLCVGLASMFFCGAWIETSEQAFPPGGGETLSINVEGMFLCFDYGEDGEERNKREFEIIPFMSDGATQYRFTTVHVGEESIAPKTFSRVRGDRYIVASPVGPDQHIEMASVIEGKITFYTYLLDKRVRSLAAVHQVTLESITDTFNFRMSGDKARQRAFTMALADDPQDVVLTFECNRKK